MPLPADSRRECIAANRAGCSLFSRAGAAFRLQPEGGGACAVLPRACSGEPCRFLRGFRMLSAVFASPELWDIITLSLRVSLSATAAAALLGLPLGTMLAVSRFPGRRVLVVLVNALLGLPPAVVGLALYLLLSRSGPLGFLELLFTPQAMILAQTVLALPIVTALSHRAAEG